MRLILLPGVVIIVVVVTAILLGRTRRGPFTADQTTGSVRRVFWYGLLAAVMVMAAIGVAGLITAAIPTDLLVGDGGRDLARSLALVVVAGPTALLLWTAQLRRLRGSANERSSIGWALYLPVMVTVALITVVVSAIETSIWLAGTGDPAPEAVGRTVAWGALWWWHRRVSAAAELSPRRGPCATVAWESTVGLVTLALGLGGTLAILLDRAYQSLFGTTLVAEEPTGWLAAAVVGLAVWTIAWLFDANRRSPTPGLQTHILITGVLGGLVTSVAAAGTLLFLVAEWLLGTPETLDPVQQFAETPGLVSAVVIGAALWGYHRSVGRPAAGAAYRYLAAGIGLGAAATGLALVVAAAIGGLVPPLAGSQTSTDVLLGGLTALVVGVPVWWGHWQMSVRAAAAFPEAEARSTARRIYLIAVLGIAGVAGLVTAVILAFRILEAALGGRSLSESIEVVAGATGTLTAAGLLAWYHLGVWRSDRRLAPDLPERVVMVVAGPAGVALAARLRSDLDAKVEVIGRAQMGEETWDLDKAMAAVANADSTRVMVVASSDGFEVIPLE